ncbi:Uncharacterised protein [Mycobacteroides abscessus]|nr:hypothetical protein MM2B0912R_0124 [Mycobacteroides abscessus subsp. bolletii 2B-0912-R]EIV19175.1 hypothetical protein MM2B0912S_4681 [Mycobacteroides abscessus subsp. bolletii 2B-0912-S]EIV71446.1 hypothetical protein MM2B1231_4739 [Mycobacteroides abscessus subsp. bolletii 2B-1231]EIV73807.1 hypothetical protein MM2B0107_4016 [Mycobacteroides abscessus subsp. bolletii 2B-0107]MBE5480292.1 hypothetical protein [Mycobacteroides abscessus]SHX14477.1 Uncharacterised protein [Mycobacteroides
MNRRSGFTVVDPDAALADAVRSGDRFRIDQDLWLVAKSAVFSAAATSIVAMIGLIGETLGL